MASETHEEEEYFPSFPSKLFHMVENVKYDGIIWWTENGDGFFICKEREFVKSDILDKYKVKSYGSFTRQLGKYGFHKKRRPTQERANGPSSYYCHDEGYFKRGCKDLLVKIIKKENQGTKKVTSSKVEPEQMLNLRGIHKDLSQETETPPSFENDRNEAWHCNPAALFASTTTSTFPKGDAARRIMADGGAPSVSCVGQSSVTQGGQMQFSKECTTTQITMPESEDYQSIHEAVSAPGGNNPDYQYDPMDPLNFYHLKGLDFFDMDKDSPFDLKDARGVLPEDLTNSDQLFSHQSTTTEVTPQFPITTPDASGGETDRGYSSSGSSFQGQIVQEVAAFSIHGNRNSCEIPAFAATASKKPETDNLVHEGSSFQDQIVQEVAACSIHDNRNSFEIPVFAATASKKPETDNLVHEGNSSQEQEVYLKAKLQVDPSFGPVKGGQPFSLQSEKVLPEKAWACFGNSPPVAIGKTVVDPCNLFGKTPRGEPGPVKVQFFDTNWVYFGEDTYTYYEPEKPEKRKKQCLPSKKRKRQEMKEIKDVIRETVEATLKQLKRESNKEPNETMGSQKGPANQEIELRPVDVLKPLVYAGAQAGASELIQIIFNLPVAKIIFETYKNESCLPEDIAEENGHKEIAHFLRGITKRYCKENNTSLGQPDVIDWLAFFKALDEIEFDQSETSSDTDDSKQVRKDVLQTGYCDDCSEGESSVWKAGTKMIIKQENGDVPEFLYSGDTEASSHESDSSGKEEAESGQTGTTERGSYVEKADFTYKNPKKKRNCQGLSNKRNLDEVYGIVRDLEKKVKQIEQSDNDEENRSSFEQGLVNPEKHLEPGKILKHLVYAAAEAGIMKLIKTVFRSPAGRIVCGMCQEENSLPEDVADENGHEKVATYLRGITKRYSLEERCTTSEQSSTVAFDWLELLSELKDKLNQTKLSSDKDFKQILEDDITERGYSADGETSSSGSEKGVLDSDDELNKTGTWKVASEVKRKAPYSSDDVTVFSENGERYKLCAEISTDDKCMESPVFSSEVSEDLSSVTATLERRDLWDCFNKVGTQMIITKSDRKLSLCQLICIGWVVVGVCMVVALSVSLWWYFTQEKKEDMPSSFGGPYSRQAVVTDCHKCSEIGNKILNSNGSAVDASIASLFCLGVINMQSSGVGGGGVMLVYSRKLKKAKVVDFRETAPAATTSDMFPPNKTGQDLSKRGGLAIAVPGEVNGLYRAWKEYGRLPWKDLVQPAINLAREGFPISAAVADALNDVMVEKIKRDPGLRELLLDENDKPYKKGTIIKNEKYAMTLEKIRDYPESFYNGSLAKMISQDIRIRIPPYKERKGQVTEQDLRNYQTEIREPLESELAGMKMLLTPPPTSGAVLGLILNILKGYNMTSSARNGTDASVLTYHRIIEAFKFGFAWRSRLGDPAFNMDKNISEIAQKMIEQQFGDDLRREIKDNRTYNNLYYYARFYSDADYGTTHLAVLAKNGDAVSVTSTINYRFGCLFRSNLTGIIYNNQMADFDIPNDTKIDGVYPSEVNFPEPGKRPFSSISPTILTNDTGDVQLIIGACGSKRITTAVSLVLMNMLWFERDISQAVEDPRIHEELVPKMGVEVENNKDYRLPEHIQDGLRALGHNVMVESDAALAVVQAVHRKTGEGIYAKSDPRKFGAPAGG